MFQKIYRAANGIIRVKIITAMELSDETMDKIKEFVRRHTDKTIEFVHKVDPSIIGGFILQIGSRQLDASLMKELKEMSLQFGFLDYKWILREDDKKKVLALWGRNLKSKIIKSKIL